MKGDSIPQIIDTLDGITQNSEQDKPSIIIADTIKGNGVSFMEGKAAWHGAVPSDEQYAAAIKELKEV